MVEQSEDVPLLHRIRNMWQFANLCQWIYIFGKIAKIDESLEAEDIETEFLKPTSQVLNDIALCLLKLVSSHRGLTHDIFDDQLRKQYLDKSPENNPFGEEDSGLSFTDLDVCTKITVLQTLTEWTMMHPERIREKMEEQKDIDQTSWRIEPYGWDSDDRTYYVLDDNRVYRMTEPSPPPPAPKSKKRKSYSANRRSSKRHHTAQVTKDEDEQVPEEANEPGHNTQSGLGGAKWECVAVTLDEVKQLLQMLRKSRDNNQKILCRQLDEHLLPILEKQEESRKRKELQREKELLNLAKMATAKRSSRIANKAEVKKEEEKSREEEEKAKEEESRRLTEELRQRKLQKERDARLFAREKRLKERENRRHAHEEELTNLTGDGRNGSEATMRMSERRINAEIEKNKQALEDLDEEDQDWVFDCICGLYGQIDDGTHSVACERCNIWQHSKCIGVKEDEAERTDFHFICSSCRKRLEEAVQTPRKTIKIKIKTHGPNGSPIGAETRQLSPPATHGSVIPPSEVPHNGAVSSPNLKGLKQEMTLPSQPSHLNEGQNYHENSIGSHAYSHISHGVNAASNVVEAGHSSLPRQIHGLTPDSSAASDSSVTIHNPMAPSASKKLINLPRHHPDASPRSIAKDLGQSEWSQPTASATPLQNKPPVVSPSSNSHIIQNSSVNPSSSTTFRTTTANEPDSGASTSAAAVTPAPLSHFVPFTHSHSTHAPEEKVKESSSSLFSTATNAEGIMNHLSSQHRNSPSSQQ